MAHTPRAFTFDIWLTLLRSNPQFKPARNAMLRDTFAPQIPSAVFGSTLREQDRAADRIGEQTGRDLGFVDRLALTLAALKVPLDRTDPRIADAVVEQGRLALQMPPMVMSAELPELLTRLASRYPVALISNTGFLPGALMRQLLSLAGLPTFVGYSFSDEVGVSKPDPAIFAHAMKSLRNVQAGLSAAHVLHVGDNPVADVEGATAAGWCGALVNVVGAPPVGDLIGRYVSGEAR